jgi:hypothetical protein
MPFPQLLLVVVAFCCLPLARFAGTERQLEVQCPGLKPLGKLGKPVKSLYPFCRAVPPRERLVNQSQFVILTVTDSDNVHEAVSWWETMRDAGFAANSYVGAYDASLCPNMSNGCFQLQEAFIHMDATSPQDEVVQGPKWRQAVKNKLIYIKHFLKLGLDVLFTDLDVFYDISQHETVFDRVLQYSTTVDFVAQDNGVARRRYERVNLGFFYMRTSPTAIQYIDCTIAIWDYPEFAKSGGRLQPHFNRIFEEVAMQGRWSMCILGRERHLFKHFTGAILQ